MNSSIERILAIIVPVICALGWIMLYVYHKKTGRPWTFVSVRIMQGVVFLLCAVGAVIAIGVSNSKDSGWWLEQATAEKTPAHVFLSLTPESTEEDLYTFAAMQDLCVIQSSQTNGKTSLFYVMVDPSYLSHKEGDGVLLEVEFSNVTGDFVSCELVIKTEDGTAKCGVEIGDNGLAEYEVSIKTVWYKPAQVFFAESAQAAVQIAYAEVYPNGLA